VRRNLVASTAQRQRLTSKEHTTASPRSSGLQCSPDSAARSAASGAQAFREPTRQAIKSARLAWRWRMTLLQMSTRREVKATRTATSDSSCSFAVLYADFCPHVTQWKRRTLGSDVSNEGFLAARRRRPIGSFASASRRPPSKRGLRLRLSRILEIADASTECRTGTTALRASCLEA
jgi:hypothetical protein